MITYGGTLSCLRTMAPSIKVYFKRLSSIKLIMKPFQLNEEENILKIIELANVAGKEGLLAVEEAANEIEDDYDEISEMFEEQSISSDKVNISIDSGSAKLKSQAYPILSKVGDILKV